MQPSETTKEATFIKEPTGEVTKNYKETVTRNDLVKAVKAAQINQAAAQKRLDAAILDVTATQTQLDSYDALVKLAK